MKKLLICIITIVVLVICFCFIGIIFSLRQGASIVIKNNEISSETMTATISDTTFQDGWFSGKISIEDEYFDEYMKEHANDENIAEYFSDYYDISYVTPEINDVLPSPSGGYVVDDDGHGYYYEEFNTYINMNDGSVEVQIYINGIEEPFIIKLK